MEEVTSVERCGEREHATPLLLLRCADEFELQEIADALAIPLGTVKSRLHQALQHLRADPRLARFFADGNASRPER